MNACARPVAIVALLLGSVALGAATGGGKTPRPPNILLILADDLGSGDLGCYGQTRICTPHLDRLAREGMRFTRFYAGAPVCAPSRGVLMTGQHTGHALVRANGKINLRPEDITVAQLLQRAGYATGLVGKWGLGAEGSAGAPRAQGFGYFFGYADQTHAHNYYPTFLVCNEEHVRLRNVVPDEGAYGEGVATTRLDYAPDLLIDDALAFLERHRREPFFLYFAPILPHANNQVAPGKSGMEIPDYGEYAQTDWPEPQKGLAAMITRLDGDVGRLLARLDELGLARDTLVIFVSDNGPHNENGNDPQFFRSAGALRGIKADLYEGGIRVPLIVRWPGRTLAGAVSDHAGYWLAFALHPLPPPDFDYASVGVRPGELQSVVLPGFFAHWNEHTNFAGDFDRWFLNLFPTEKPFVFNSGGYQTLNFIPSLITMILGLMAGERLRVDQPPRAKARWIVLAGLACLALGLLAGATVCPIVKRIWTPSWALASGGIVLLALAAFYIAIDVRGWKRWTFPLVVVGTNSIAIYLMDILVRGWVGGTLKVHLGTALFGGIYGIVWLRCAALLVLWLAGWWMYRRKLFLKI